MSNRRQLSRVLAAATLLLVVSGMVVALALVRPDRADFTFCNGTEIKTVDPALVTGQPEGRVVWAVFEGLTSYHPQTLEPLPGVAESWEISPDGKRYTFRLRREARWSDGRPITAEDFHWSFQRLLHPETAAEYAYEMWYVSHAEQYTAGRVAVGDPVEIELPDRPPGAAPFARGTVLYGRLLAVEGLGSVPASNDGPAADDAPASGDPSGEPVYVVEIGGRRRRFQRASAVPRDPAAEDYDWLLYDFRRVGIQVVDPHTLRITLNHPVPYFLEIVGFYPMSPVPRHCVERYGYPAWTKPENIVCNGPFILKSRRIRDRIRLEKNPYYWDSDHVRLNSIDVLAVESAVTGLNLYLTGSSDWIPSVPNEIVPDLLRSGRTDFRPAPYLATEYYIFNTRRKPLDDARVRRAIAMAVNKQEIAARVLRSGQIPAASLVPEDIAKYVDYQPPRCEPYAPERAAALLAEAGYPGGGGMPRLELLYNTHESHQAIAELLQSQWKRSLGLDVRLTNQDWARYLASRRQGEFWISRAGWIADYLDPNTFLEMFTTGNPNNHGGWSRPEYDALVSAAQVEARPEVRMRLFRRAEEILLQEMPLIPLYWPVTRNMVQPRVRGFYPNILDIHPLKDIGIDDIGIDAGDPTARGSTMRNWCVGDRPWPWW
ncbi:MAG: peptide ABC transporter substrate-binding protein [Thermogutta sp.]|nr:peptide ABC transporter substrate-binding protein [Thermogutta sp.]